MQVIVTLITLLFYLYHLHIASRTHGLFIHLFYNFSLYAYVSDDHFDHISDHICSSYVSGSRRQVRGGDEAWPIGRFVQHQPTGADILRLHHDRAGALNLGSVRERCCKGGRRKKQGFVGCSCQKQCSTKHCSCVRAGMLCNSRCHSSTQCKNK